MRALWTAVAVVWFAGWAVCSYRVFAAGRPLPVEVQAESSVPPSLPATVPRPARTFTPDELLAGIPRSPATTRSSRPATPNASARRAAVPPLPLSLRRPTPAPRNASQVSVPALPVPNSVQANSGVHCLLCSEPAYSWVERDGERYGYCRKHQGKPAGGTARSVEASGQKQQCLGMTRTGTRCRRQTSDPSGYCYQHQSR